LAQSSGSPVDAVLVEEPLLLLWPFHAGVDPNPSARFSRGCSIASPDQSIMQLLSAYR